MTQLFALALRALSPLLIAGYFTWGVVAFDVWRASARWASGGNYSARSLALLMMIVFLIAFVLQGTSHATPTSTSASRIRLLILLACTVGLLWSGPSSLTPILLVVVTVVWIGGFATREAGAGLICLNVVFFCILRWRWHVENPLFEAAVYISFQVFAALTTMARKSAEESAARLRHINAQLLATRALLSESARDSERLRVSRELHDVTGHNLTALLLNLEALTQDDTMPIRRELKLCQQLAMDLLADVRTVVARLRYDDGIDIREALKKIAEPFPRPAIELNVSEAVRIDGAERAETLIRVCQEAITNAVKHSNAAHIWLSLTTHDNVVELVVKDDGTYTGQHRVGAGLAGMQERVDYLQGRLRTARGAQGGFELSIAIPNGRDS